jgi:ATP-dependent DNA helicase RecG
MKENQLLDKKSIRYVLNKHKDARSLAADCVGFANAFGGVIALGVEDDAMLPPAAQHISDELPESLRKRIGQLTVNVAVIASKVKSENGGEYVELRVMPSQQTIAATSDAHYFIRVSDETKRLMPDDLGRLFADKSAFTWELQLTRQDAEADCDEIKLADFVRQVKLSDRVSDFVKQKSKAELLEHYLFVSEGKLTNLGVLWLGNRQGRAALHYSPQIQCIKYDELGNKIQKQVWDDFSLNPLELIEAVWREVPDWREFYELPNGLFRKSVPHYDERVVRELLANALVHRPYTMRGDIFILLYPDRMEIHNPGTLPVGVTPSNILHTSSQRNPHLAKVFYDLKMMEREGSGYDFVFQSLLASGRPAPVVEEGDDRVKVIIYKRILRPEVIDFVAKADQDQTFQLTTKEIIALGMIAQHEALTALELQKLLALHREDDVQVWIGRLREWGILIASGKTKATQYSVAPDLLRKLDYKGHTTLKPIERHRLRELILSDLKKYRRAKGPEIHQRIGSEIPYLTVKAEIEEMLSDDVIEKEGEKRHRFYLWKEQK